MLRVAPAVGLTGLAALIGTLALFWASNASPDVVLEMDGEHPSFVSGLHGGERDGDRTFAWTTARTVVRLAGLDRRSDWTCIVRIRGARDAAHPMPSLTLSFDGAGTTTAALSNDFQDVAIGIPARPGRSGLTLTLDVSPTFRPGGGDQRDLGAQVDAIQCSAAGRVWPPTGAIRSAGITGAVFAAAAALSAAPSVLVLVAGASTGVGTALLLSTGGGVFGSYPDQIVSLALWGAVLLVAGTWGGRIVGRQRLPGAVFAALLVSIEVATLKLAALEHPAKPLIDALFQAHRLEWVIDGRYFFTQPMPSGVQFPYAIGLYAVAAPLAAWVTDHVFLVRLTAIVAEAIGGLCLFALVARGLQDRAAGLVALVLFHLVPGPHVVMGNANLTNAFAQSVGLAALCGIALMPTPARSLRSIGAAAVVTLGITLAFLSHVGTIVIVAAVLGVVSLTWMLSRQREVTRAAVAVIAMTAVAGLLAVGLYYRHFTDVYREALVQMRAPAVEASPAPAPRLDGPAILVRQLTWRERVANSASQTSSDIGWPVLMLAAVGLATRVGRRRDRTTLLVLGWGAAWMLLLLGSTLTPVDVQFQRYTLEFVSRVNLAGYPMLSVLAALGSLSLWRRNMAGRVASVLLVAATVAVGVASLSRWVS